MTRDVTVRLANGDEEAVPVDRVGEWLEEQDRDRGDQGVEIIDRGPDA